MLSNGPSSHPSTSTPNDIDVGVLSQPSSQTQAYDLTVRQSAAKSPRVGSSQNFAAQPSTSFKTHSMVVSSSLLWEFVTFEHNLGSCWVSYGCHLKLCLEVANGKASWRKQYNPLLGEVFIVSDDDRFQRLVDAHLLRACASRKLHLCLFNSKYYLSTIPNQSPVLAQERVVLFPPGG